MITRDLRISIRTRTEMDFFSALFPSTTPLGTLYKQANELAHLYNLKIKERGGSEYVSAGKLHATAVLHLLYQTVLTKHLSDTEPDFFTRLTTLLSKNHAGGDVLAFYMKEFPSPLLLEQQLPLDFFHNESLRGYFVHQVMLDNPALLKAAKPFISPDGLSFPKGAQALTALLGGYAEGSALVANSDEDIFTFLTRPSKLFPNSLLDQINYIISEWSELLPPELKELLLRAIDYVQEEEKPLFGGDGGGVGTLYVPDYSSFDSEYEAFSADRNWMPNVVMIAKSTLVWLDQLSKEYGYSITTLDQIPNQELDNLHERGFTALWLIGIWERSVASKRIKNLCGNPEAEASAYSLKNYEIAPAIGGWPALDNLRQRCADRSLRLASDMVPNHTGIDGDWVFNHSEYFIQQSYSPFPSYTYNGEDLSENPDIEIKLEDHYYDQTDAAVTFRRRDLRTGETSYIFHGNDGTAMPWNDTAQLDFLNPATREAVFQQIKHVARNFPIIRFDAAMTLAKKHIQRLWYPKPGDGGDIAGRSQSGLSDEEFHRLVPQEFWREVVDRLTVELPDTLLLAEAFWMMEGYFVRTLGMHRVYNSAFMNMLKNQENQKYRETIKGTLSFEPEILKRFVNFMNNPDEETAVAQFGEGDKYFGVCTLLATMPGLPMFGHGQIEGLKEKYGMEYSKAYWDEKPNQWKIDEHYRRIFPLLKKRYLFSESDYFNLFDLVDGNHVHESAFCYINGTEHEKALVLYNNQYESVQGWIKNSAPKLEKQSNDKRTKTVSLAEAMGLTLGGRRYVLYEAFPGKLTHMVPSLKVFDEGGFFRLGGYEAKVMLNIREVEDVDGTYELLYNTIGDRGVENIEQEILALRLKPVFKAMENLQSAPCKKLIRSILTGESTAKIERKLILTLAEAYTHLGVAVEQLHPVAAKALPSQPKEITPSEMLKEIQNLTALFAKEAKEPYFSQGAAIMDELPTIIAAALFLKPFIHEWSRIADAMVASDRLLLARFFAEELEKVGYSGDIARKVCHSAAILAASATMVKTFATSTPQRVLATLLQDPSVRAYANCNEHQGITWYKKEAIQEIIYLSALSFQILGDIPDTLEYVKNLTEAETLAGYKLDLLLGDVTEL